MTEAAPLALLLLMMGASPRDAGRPDAGRPGSALERLSAEVSAVVVAKRFSPPVGVYTEAAAAPLARAFSSLLSSRLAAARLAPVSIEARDSAEAERLARERGVASLVRLTVELQGASLVGRGDALGTGVNFWSGAMATRSGPAAALAFAVAADAEASMLAGGAPASPARPMELWLSSLARLPQVPAALALADLDGDRRAELLVLTRDRLLALGADGTTVGRAELLGPLAARPSREPFGAIGVAQGRVVVWSGRREKPEAFEQSLALKSLGPADGLMLDGVGLALEPGVNRFLPEVTWGPHTAVMPLALQAFSVFGAMALLCFADGTGAVARGAIPASRLSGIGTGSVLADLDGDGSPEAVVTSARTVGDVDELRILALGAFEAAQARGGDVGEATPLWQRPLRGRAVVAAAGDLDASGSDEVVLGLWQPDGTGELLVLRRVAP